MRSIVLQLFKFATTACLLTYCGAMAYLFFRQEALLFFPDPESAADAASFAAFETDFTINGETLDGWFIPGVSEITVVYYGGNADELSRSIADITRFGPFNYLLVNYRGYGDSTGRPSEAGLKNDAREILQAAAARFDFSVTDTVVIGRSLGSGIATYITAEFPVRALVLVTPYDSVTAVAQGRYPIFPVALLIKHPFDSLQYIQQITAPTLIVKSESDSVVPHRNTDNLITRWQSPLTVATLPGTHGSVVDSGNYVETVSQFIAGQFQ